MHRVVWHWGLSMTLSILLSATCYCAQDVYDDLTYSKGTFFGGATNDSYLLHVAIDKSGNIYGAGFGRDIPTSVTAYQRTCHGPYDIIIFKLDPTMTRMIWSTYIGGSNYEAAGSIAVNDSGEVFVAGYTISADFPVSTRADSNFLANGTVNYYALKLSSDGSRIIYSHILGNGTAIQQQSESASKGAQIAIDPSDNAYVLSQTASSNYVITSNATQKTIAGGRDLVITKLDASGTIVYSSYIGGRSDDNAGEVIYAQGKLYCTGSTSSTDFPMATHKTPDAQDAFVLSLNSGAILSPITSYVFGGSGLDRGISLCYDSHSNRICMTGSSSSTDMQYTTTFNVGQSTGGFIASLDPQLSATNYVSLLGTGIVPTSIVARQANSSVFVSGYTSSTIPLTSNAFSSTLHGQLDGVMFSVDSSGSGLRYGTYIGGSRQDYSTAKVLLFEQGCALRVIFGITTHSSDFPSSTDSFQPNKLNGGEDQPALAMFSQLNIDPRVTVTAKKCSAEMRFTVQIPCPPLGIQWNFGDGGETVGFGPITHVYSHNGTFTVKITLVYPEPDTIVLLRTVVVTNVPDSVRAQHLVYACSKDPRVQLVAFNCQRYEWFPGDNLSDSTVPNPVLRNAKNGKYYVRGWDANGCVSLDSVSVYIIAFKAVVDSNALICKGTKVTLHAAGGSQYQWSPAAGLDRTDRAVVTASPTQTTIYQVIVKDGNCPDTAHITVVVEQPRVLRCSPDITVCPQSQARLTALLEGDTSGVQYQWFPAGGLSDPQSANPIVFADQSIRYYVVAHSALGCPTRDSVMVHVENHIVAHVSPDAAVCEQQSVQLVASGGASYRWDPPDDLDNPSSPQPMCLPTKDRNYTVIVSSGTCLDSTHVQVRVLSKPSVQGTGGGLSCSGDAVHFRVLMVDSGMSYTWTPRSAFDNPDSSAVVAHPTQDAEYVVTVRSPLGCVSSDTLRHHVDNALSVKLGPDTSLCLGTAVALSYNAGFDDIQWFPSDGALDTLRRIYVVQPTHTTHYIMTARRGGCIGQDTVTVNIGSPPTILMQHRAAVCAGQFFELDAQSALSGVTYRWEPATLVEDARAASTRTVALYGAQKLYCIASHNGCESIDSVTIELHPQPIITPSVDTAICPTEATTLRVSCTTLDRVQWYPPRGLSSTTDPIVLASPDQTTVYTAVVVDQNGCVDSSHITVSIKPEHRYHFSLNSLSSLPGTLVDLIISAQSDSNVVTPIQLELQLNRDIFLPIGVQEIHDDELQRLAVSVPVVELGASSKEVARIRGMMLSTGRVSSEMILTRSVVDGSSCPLTTTSPGFIANLSCAPTLRKYSLASDMRALIFPHPVGSTLHLQLHADTDEVISVEVISVTGEKHFQHLVHQTSLDQDHNLDVQSLAAGEYLLRISTLQQSVNLRFIKVE